MNNESELPSCPTPWCDHSEPPYVWQGPDDGYCVICAVCQVEGPSRDTEYEAVEEWGTRAVTNHDTSLSRGGRHEA